VGSDEVSKITIPIYPDPDPFVRTAFHESAHAVTAVVLTKPGQHGLCKNGVCTLSPRPTPSSLSIRSLFENNMVASVEVKNQGRGKARVARSIVIDLAGGFAGYRVAPWNKNLDGGMSSDIDDVIQELSKIHPELRSASKEILTQSMKDENRRAFSIIANDEAGLEIDHVCLAIRAHLRNEVSSLQTEYFEHNDGRKVLGPDILARPWYPTLVELINRTNALLDEHWSAVEAFAALLIKRDTISGPSAEKYIRRYIQKSAKTEVAA
jgi:hypothetical protein